MKLVVVALVLYVLKEKSNEHNRDAKDEEFPIITNILTNTKYQRGKY